MSTLQPFPLRYELLAKGQRWLPGPCKEKPAAHTLETRQGQGVHLFYNLLTRVAIPPAFPFVANLPRLPLPSDSEVTLLVLPSNPDTAVCLFSGVPKPAAVAGVEDHRLDDAVHAGVLAEATRCYVALQLHHYGQSWHLYGIWYSF